MGLFVLVSLTLAPFFFAGILEAGETAESMEVRAYGTAEAESKETQAVYDSVKVSDHQGRIVSLPEVLSEQAGVHITRYGGVEDATTLSIRGSKTDEMVVTLDGIPLQSATGEGINLSGIILETLESIEVYRGMAPINSGFASTAGAIILNSAKPKEKGRFDSSIGYGSFNTLKSHLSYSDKTGTGGRGPFSCRVTANISKTAGDFKFLDDNGTPVNSADDQVVQRRNNASQTIYPSLHMTYDIDKNAQLTGNLHFIRQDRGVPGLSSNQSDTSAANHTEWLAGLRYQREHFLHRNLMLENLSYVRLVKDQFADLNGEIGLGGAQDNDDDTTLLGNKLSFEWFPLSNHQITSFILYQGEWFRPENFLASPSRGGLSIRHTLNTGVSDQISLVKGKLLLTPSFWLENAFNNINNDDPSFLTPATFFNNESDHQWSGALGVKGRVAPKLHLEGHLNRSVRFPSFPELFGDRGGVVGNPFLDPQESVNWDAGLRLQSLVLRQAQDERFFCMGARPCAPTPRHGELVEPSTGHSRWNFSSFYFDRHVSDLIQFQQNSGFARAENVGKAHLQGIELQGAISLFNHLNFNTNYTYQRALDHGDNEGRHLPGVPAHELDARVEGFGKKGKIFFAVNWIDSNYLDPLNTRVVKDRVILVSGISYKPSEFMTLSFEAKNLADQQIVDVVGFPLPGRSFFGKMELSR